ncbi:hypothetical protein L2E82_36811 [Cichorium intybus]|uniref:Uncharacterized protein n=1 Tax=Cichorium intybus TaxID=13427 RepID=A0ACB9ADH3_CICIN|nr:hypothetical protein L2E82_36811 [Cichorium intybus]
MEKIAAAHLKHSYDYLCNTNVQQLESKSYTVKIKELFTWIFSHITLTERTTIKGSLLTFVLIFETRMLFFVGLCN